jgi:hypothetical protein
MRRALASAFQPFETAIDQERDAALHEALAKKRAIAVTQRMIQDGGRKPIVLNRQQSIRSVFVVVISAPVGSKDCAISKAIRGSSSTTRMGRPRRVGPCMMFPVARQSANCQRQGGHFPGPLDVPSRRSNPSGYATHALIDCHEAPSAELGRPGCCVMRVKDTCGKTCPP